MRRPDAHAAVVHLRVLEERDEAPRRAALVAEPEVTRVGIVVVALPAHEGQPEQVAVERGRAVEVAADRGDVVQARCSRMRRCPLEAHARNPRPPERARKTARPQGEHGDRRRSRRRRAGRPCRGWRAARAARRRPAPPRARRAASMCERKPARCSRIGELDPGQRHEDEPGGEEQHAPARDVGDAQRDEHQGEEHARAPRAGTATTAPFGASEQRGRAAARARGGDHAASRGATEGVVAPRLRLRRPIRVRWLRDSRRRA